MISFAETDIGNIRKINEDYIFASDESVGLLPNLYIVADGMGGHQAGDYASRYATERLVRLIAESTKKNPVAIINESIRIVNEELYSQSKASRNLEGMGTTLVVATIYDDTLYVANVGDSRLYRMGQELRQITRDHSWVEEMVREGRLTRDSALYWEKKNIITRAIGVYEQVTADFFEVELEPGNRILICSDGLSNMVEDQMIREILRQESSVLQAGRVLIRTAKVNGGKDNISVILVDPELGEVKVC